MFKLTYPLSNISFVPNKLINYNGCKTGCHFEIDKKQSVVDHQYTFFYVENFTKIICTRKTNHITV